jgi:transposase
MVTADKDLKNVERNFRHIKADDLDVPPVFRRFEERVRAHVLICMLACYLTWHPRQERQNSAHRQNYLPKRLPTSV